LAIVLLLILAALWVALLLPPHLRNRAENRPADSIGDFRHQLRVLDRIGPTAVSPANSLRGARRPIPPIGLGLGRPAPTPSGHLAAEVVAARRYAAVRAMSPDAVRRRSSQRRRRDILFSLVGLTGLSAIIGFVPGLSVLWLVTAVVGVLLAFYVGLLLHMRNRSAERDMKVHFLPARGARVGAPDPSPVPAPAFAYRRTAQ
jgi:hypothetical protein